MTNAQPPPSRGMVIFSVSFYISTALIMVLVNKWVLTSYALPFTLLWFQVFLAIIFLHISSLFGLFILPVIKKEICIGLMPLIIINVLGLSFNTLCLQYVDASFYQVARALVLPFTVLFSYIFLKQKSSEMILLACLIVCIGFIVGVSSERLTVTMLGTLFGVLSSVSTALHAIVIKKSLEVVKGNTMELVYYNNILSIFAFTPLIFLFNEQTEGFFGFLINIAGFLQIKVTSPVTHMISSAFRGVIQTVFGALIFGDILTIGRVEGIALILAGSCFYTWIKDRESKKNTATTITTTSTTGDVRTYDKLENGEIEDDNRTESITEVNEK
ncbi:2869_t:CDS:2 [Diversispora eburnea]|uniref:2869_t:CDS:1 n=1 Tax=Diversispora eburnea TaxID=1213867 RepID=A0A9N9CHJ4_9GLOM|nr:2869_t:CDS:2 [Diversispora eburnea]